MYRVYIKTSRKHSYIYILKFDIREMFKEKTSKKKLNIDNKEISTLDAMHNKMIKNFENTCKEKEKYEEVLKNYNNINQNILAQIDYLRSIQDKEKITMLWSSNIQIKENIIELQNKIKELNEFDEIEYYKNTSDILFQYYDTLEKQSTINYNIQIPTLITNHQNSKMKSFKSKSEKKKKNLNPNGINVLEALNKTVEVDTTLLEDQKSNTDNENQKIENEDNIGNKNVIDKSTLVDNYLSIINKQHIKRIDEEEIEICRVCKNSMTCLQYDAIMICNICGYQELLLVEQNRPILKQNTKDTSHFSYKRINHFREWCNQVQGKESTDIPDEVFEKILNEIKKEKITDTKTITYNKMRDILKRLRINKYYEHINYIINRINGIPTPQFSPELEEKLCNMFRNIQGPFLKHCPKDRKNFLSYSYVLYKFFQILGLHEYLKYFPLLKSREKLYVQDQIWKKICKELNYQVIPSL